MQSYLPIIQKILNISTVLYFYEQTTNHLEYFRNRSSQKDDTALWFCLLPRGYWDEAHIMIWGPSAKVLAENSELQKLVIKVQQTGVKFSCCVVCSDDYGVTDKLASLGIDMTHTGEMLTQSLQSDWKVLTF